MPSARRKNEGGGAVSGEKDSVSRQLPLRLTSLAACVDLIECILQQLNGSFYSNGFIRTEGLRDLAPRGQIFPLEPRGESAFMAMLPDSLPLQAVMMTSGISVSTPGTTEGLKVWADQKPATSGLSR